MVQTETDRPKMPDTSPDMPLGRRLYEEIVYHLLPWGPKFPSRSLAFKAVSLGLAAVVTIMWILGLGAEGKMGPAAVIGWWTGWSLYEIMVRMQCKPWVKEGPWWKGKPRKADWADMTAYVLTKNLMIGVVLFLVLRFTGVLDFLHEQPSLKWMY